MCGLLLLREPTPLLAGPSSRPAPAPSTTAADETACRAGHWARARASSLGCDSKRLGVPGRTDGAGERAGRVWSVPEAGERGQEGAGIPSPPLHRDGHRREPAADAGPSPALVQALLSVLLMMRACSTRLYASIISKGRHCPKCP